MKKKAENSDQVAFSRAAVYGLEATHGLKDTLGRARARLCSCALIRNVVSNFYSFTNFEYCVSVNAEAFILT